MGINDSGKKTTDADDKKDESMEDETNLLMTDS